MGPGWGSRACTALVLFLLLDALSLTAFAGNPLRAEHYLRRGVEAMRAEEFGKAEDLFLRARRADPLLPQPEMLLGHLAMARREFSDAENAYLRAIELHRNLKSSLQRQNEQYLQSARDELAPLQEALAQASNATSGADGFESRRMQREAELQLKERRLEHAAINEEDVRVPGELFLFLGNARLRSGRPELAVEAYREAVNLLPDAPEPRHNLAVALAQSSRIPEALRECDRAARMGYAPSIELRRQLEVLLDRSTADSGTAGAGTSG